MDETYHYMRLRKAPYTEFKRISTSLDDFSPLGTSPIFMINNIPMMDLDPVKTWDINYIGRVRVARMAKKLGVKKYIVASSCSVYGFRDDIADENSKPNPLTTICHCQDLVDFSLTCSA